jgi:coenzyme PQQ synthesis protein D (PqqD)
MTYHPPAHVQFRAVDDEIVLLDTRRDAYFGLNPTGAVAWSALAAGRTAEAAAAAISAEFDVEPTLARIDVAALIDQLVASGLLEPLAS